MFHSSMYTAPYNIKKTRYETERIRRLVHNVLKNIRVNEFLVYSFFYIVYQNVEDVAVGLNIPPPRRRLSDHCHIVCHIQIYSSLL